MSNRNTKHLIVLLFVLLFSNSMISLAGLLTSDPTCVEKRE
jgi:hypothetical protein